MANVEIIANEKDDTYRSKQLLFLVTQSGYHFPTKKEMDDLIRALKSRGQEVNRETFEKILLENRQMILDAAMIDATKSQSLKNLISSAQNSDLSKDRKQSMEK